MKQTAVEYLIQELKLNESMYKSTKDILDKAKSMDIEHKKFMFDCGRQYQLTGEGTFTQVYQETYGGGQDE